MKTIHKYVFVPGRDQTILMPENAQFLSVHEQADDICLWALVDPTSRAVYRKFRVIGTGHHIENATCLAFLGSVHLENGRYVFHVFEDKS